MGERVKSQYLLCYLQTYLHYSKPKSIFSYPKSVSNLGSKKVSKGGSGVVRDGLCALEISALCKRDIQDSGHHPPGMGQKRGFKWQRKNFIVFFLPAILNLAAISQPSPVTRQVAGTAINCGLSSDSLGMFFWSLLEKLQELWENGKTDGTEAECE